MKQTLTAFFILLFAILGIGIFYQYPAMLHLLPQGSHLWRQADCMAMTQNYQQFHLAFLHPATYNLQSLNGNVAGEFPVFYFLAAQFKNAAFALRLIHSLIFISGILSTYFIAFYFLQRRLLPIFCSILIFTSPLLVFYGNNFLSDVPALSMVFIAWAIFLYAYKKEKTFRIFLAFVFFTFAALLKASESINLLLCFTFCVLSFKNNPIKKTSFYFSILFSAVSFLTIFLWYFYAKQYNQHNNDSYYFLSFSPIWKASFHDIGLGIWRMTISNSKNYFWRPTSVIMIISAYFLIRHRKKLNKDLSILITSGLCVTMLYILFFYIKMIGHEYYYVPFFIFLLFGIIGILKIYNLFHAENVFTHTFAYIFLMLNIIYCKNFVEEKRSDTLYNGYLSSNEMQLFLEKNGVSQDKSIISLPDDSPNKTLYQLKRKGFTEFNDYESILKDKKADFLIVENNFAQQHTLLEPYLKDSIGNFNGFVLYKLK